MSGELLAVTDTGVLLLSTRVVFAGYRGVRTIQIWSSGSASSTLNTAALDLAERQRLRYYSRFPSGLDGDRLASFLALFDQQTLDAFPPRVGTGALYDAARLAARRLARPEDATAAGYRPLGPDFPGMGQHWVNIRTLMGGRVDPAEPAVLSYTWIDGEATLVNVAHVVVREGHDAPPDLFDVPPEAWHGHSGTVEDAILEGHGAPASGEPGLGVSMLHVWLVPNPEGVLAQHNWLLPFQRLGLEVPAMAAEESSAQGLALATAAGEDYQQQVVRGLLVGERRRAGEEVVRRRAAEARATLEELAAEAVIGRDQLAALGELWMATGFELAGLAPDAATRTRIVDLYGLGHEGHGAPADATARPRR